MLIGSVKTNIGHTESAAGIAGLIKVLLMMKYGKLVPSLHLKSDKSNLNPEISLDQYDMDISLDVKEWKTNSAGRRVGCVNSFGFGGSNCHAIVVQMAAFQNPFVGFGEDVSVPKFVCLSAVDIVGLETTALGFHHEISESSHNLSSISYTSTCHRDHFPYRLCYAAKTVEDLMRQVGNIDVKDKKPNMATNLIFVYCGVGTTWTGMCSTLMYTDQTFRNSVELLDKYIVPAAGFSVAEKFRNPMTDYSDPFLNHIAIFAAQVALTDMWKELGIHPDVIVGQSVGEVAAAYASRSIDMKNAVDVIYTRSKILAKQTGGAMMVVKNFKIKEIERLCDRFDRKVSIAVYSSPIACTLSGDADVMAQVKNELHSIAKENAINIHTIDLNVSCAYHSHQMEPCLSEIKDQLKHIQPHTRSLPVVSTVTGKLAAETEFQTSEYWAQNVRQPVKFSKALEVAAKDNAKNIFIEIGPKGVLAAHFKDIFKQNDSYCFQSMRYKKEVETKMSTIQQLYEHGLNIEWKSVQANKQPISTIPRYGFSKVETLYIPDVERRNYQGLFNVQSSEHKFVQSSLKKGKAYQILLSRRTTPFVYEHFLLDKVLVPGAIYVEAALAVGSRMLKRPVNDINISVEFKNPLFPMQGVEYQIDCEVEETQTGALLTFSKDKKVFCTSELFCKQYSKKPYVDIDPIRRRCIQVMTKRQVYDRLEDLNFKYGVSLSLIQQAWSSDIECLAEIIVHDSLLEEMGRTHLHPAIVDAVFQLFGILKKNTAEARQTYPKGVKSLVVNRSPLKKMYAYAVSTESDYGENHFNALIVDPHGNIICEMKDFYTAEEHDSILRENSLEYKLEWCLITQDDSVDRRGTEIDSSGNNILILCPEKTQTFFEAKCRRFSLTFISPTLLCNGNRNHLKEKLTVLNESNLKAVVYAPMTDNVLTAADGTPLYTASKQAFVQLSVFLTTLNSLSFKTPVYVVTERTQDVLREKSKLVNVNDSHIWGMVRCTRNELLQFKIYMIDIDTKYCDENAFYNIINQQYKQEEEFAIDGMHVYVSRIKRIPLDRMSTTQKRNINLETKDVAYLKTATHTCVENPVFELLGYETNTNHASVENICLQLTSFGLHRSEIYAITSDCVDGKLVVWPELAEMGFQTVTVEGEGMITSIDKNNIRMIQDQKVYFCYPVDAATYVAVPKELTVAQTDLPFYEPGLLTVAVLLLSLSSQFADGSSVCIVSDNNCTFAVEFLAMVLQSKKRCSLSTLTRHELLDMQRARNNGSCIAVLSKVDMYIVKVIVDLFPHLEHIATFTGFLSNDTLRWVKHNYSGIKVSVLSPDALLEEANLKKEFPLVTKWLTFFHSKVGSLNTDLNTNNPLSLPWPCISVSPEVGTQQVPLRVEKSQLFRRQGCYVVVGGLTGLGWILLNLIAEMGGGYIVSISRRKPSDENLLEIKKIMKQRHVQIDCMQVDVCDLEGLKKAFHTLKQNLGRIKIKGIFNGAGALADKSLANMTETEIDKAMSPKILGSWNLHLISQQLELDFFVLHSSIVSVLGNAGQSNYAAGNSFMDSLAHYRRSYNICGQSINWGVLNVGMAKESERIAQHLRRKGLEALKDTDIRSCFIRALMTNKVQVAFGKFDWPNISKEMAFPSKLQTVLPRDYLNKKSEDGVQSVANEIDFSVYEKSTEEEKAALLLDLVKETMCQAVSGLNKSDLLPDTCTALFFIESLDAYTFVNKISDVTGCKIEATTLRLEETTVGGIVDFLLEHIGKVDTHPSDFRVHDSLLELNTHLTFMEKAVLLDYIKAPDNPALIRVFDIEMKLKDVEFDVSFWIKVLQHVIVMNKELCKIFITDADEFDARYLSEESVHLDFQMIPFESVEQCDRHEMSFDLTREIPIKFQMAHKDGCVILRMILHAVITDLASVALICKDIRNTALAIVHGNSLPSKREAINVPKKIHSKVNHRFSKLKQFWGREMESLIKPITLGRSAAGELNGKFCRFIKGNIPRDIAQETFRVVGQKGFTLFQLFTSVYQLFLYRMTKFNTIPVLSTADMRIHTPELQGYVARCINNVPCVANIYDEQTIDEFLTSNTSRIGRAVENSAYPYQLVEKEILSEQIKEHIGRHRIVMDNMTDFGMTMQYKDSSIRVKNTWHTRDQYETFWYIEYDTNTQHMSYQFGYNAEVCGEERGAKFPDQLLSLLKSCCFSAHEMCLPNTQTNDYQEKGPKHTSVSLPRIDGENKEEEKLPTSKSATHNGHVESLTQSPDVKEMPPRRGVEEMSNATIKTGECIMINIRKGPLCHMQTATALQKFVNIICSTHRFMHLRNRSFWLYTVCQGFSEHLLTFGI